MKKAVIKKLIMWLVIAGVLSGSALAFLMVYNRQVSKEATADIGSLYMSETMFQMQEHFSTIVDLKHGEAMHIVEHTVIAEGEMEYRTALCDAAMNLDFEYLALYTQSGKSETILGKDAWYRNLQGFIAEILEGKISATTGYLTSDGGKYLVFGVPANYEMENGEISDVLLAGFSVDKLSENIGLDELEQQGNHTHTEIILTNGSYVLKRDDVEEKNYFEHVDSIGSFVGESIEDGVARIEKAMAQGVSFSATVSLDGVVQHIYGAPMGEPDDWYFVISMPQGASDEIISAQNRMITHAFCVVGLVILLLFLSVFIAYFRMSMGQLRDVEKAYNDAQAAKMEAEMANKAKSMFLSNMSHDIRTPMNAIVGFATIAEDSFVAKDYNKTWEVLGKMKHSSDYLRGLISDVLDMSKIESGMLSLVPEPISLRTIVENVVEIASVQTAVNEQIFDVNVHDIYHDGILCDYTRLNQVLINIVGNAMKFTPREGKIDFEVWQEQPATKEEYISTYFVVKDTGIGMSEAFIKTIFDSFVREDSKVRKIEGTGLGLTISKSLLDMMGGQISVESKEGEGSKFTITVDFPKVENVQRTEAVSVEHIDLTKIKILLAEDNDFNYEIAQTLLENNGLVVERAENGQMAVDKYCQNPKEWDLILMDLRMPILDGYEAAKKIREYEAKETGTLHVPIVALSADVFADDVEHCLEVGMEGHIGKPIDMSELLYSIQQYVVKDK